MSADPTFDLIPPPRFASLAAVGTAVASVRLHSTDLPPHVLDEVVRIVAAAGLTVRETAPPTSASPAPAPRTSRRAACPRTPARSTTPCAWPETTSPSRPAARP
ncbi:MAG: hypothetical protein ABIL09_04995, partial [Gemmatimonadota bacterium]